MGWKHQVTGVAVAASLVMMGGTAAAQSATSGSQGSQHGGQSATGGHGQESQASSPASEAVNKFYKKAAMGNVAEIQLGKLGAEKAQNPQVKQFAQMMVDAHQRALDELKQVAAGNVEWPSALDEKHQKLHNKLSALSGEEFDREFMDAMVDAHESMEDLLEDHVEGRQAGNVDPTTTTGGMGGTTTGTTTGQTTAGGSSSGSAAGSGAGSGTGSGAGQGAAGTAGSSRPGDPASPRLSGAAYDWASKALQEVRSHLEQAKDLKDQVDK